MKVCDNHTTGADCCVVDVVDCGNMGSVGSLPVETPFVLQAGQLFLPICNHLSTQVLWKKCLQDITLRSSSGS